jgi:Gpi18-like mannosyltransferase
VRELGQVSRNVDVNRWTDHFSRYCVLLYIPHWLPEYFMRCFDFHSMSLVSQTRRLSSSALQKLIIILAVSTRSSDPFSRIHLRDLVCSTTLSYPVGTRGSFPGGKAAGA